MTAILNHPALYQAQPSSLFVAPARARFGALIYRGAA
jgi:hypothetical protein